VEVVSAQETRARSAAPGTGYAQEGPEAHATVRQQPDSGGVLMLWTIVVILLILWLLGFTVMNVGSLIHILLVIAIVVVLIRVIQGRRPV
jgi:UDP-N-acetylmuramyl pentapeptide phosphotransferase/UDP-N-acetylglucosamine-1-phosphate transferase